MENGELLSRGTQSNVSEKSHRPLRIDWMLRIDQGTSINSNLIENSYGRAALSAFVRLQ
jgi:hypothetical protein